MVKNKFAFGLEVVINETNKIRKKKEGNLRKEKTQENFVEAITESQEPIVKVDPASQGLLPRTGNYKVTAQLRKSGLRNNRTLSDFLLHELEDVEFTNPAFREIYKKFKAVAESNKKIDELLLFRG